MLKCLTGIYHPDKGTIGIDGTVAALLELGAGFHAELSGRENVFLNGAILGMSKKDIERQFDSIVEFAGVERFIDIPVKDYSSGMTIRLGFSIAAHVEPDPRRQGQGARHGERKTRRRRARDTDARRVRRRRLPAGPASTSAPAPCRCSSRSRA